LRTDLGISQVFLRNS